MTYIIEAPKDVISWVIHLMRLLKNWVTFLIYGAVQQYILAAPFCSSVKQPHNILIKWNGFTAILAAEADLNHQWCTLVSGNTFFSCRFWSPSFFPLVLYFPAFKYMSLPLQPSFLCYRKVWNRCFSFPFLLSFPY